MLTCELEYLIDSKEEVTNFSGLRNFDVFISAFNDSERVEHVYSKISARKKIWWILPEYNYAQSDYSHLSPVLVIDGLPTNEAQLVLTGLEKSGIAPYQNLHVCIDITGFMRPQILMILKNFKEIPAASLTIIYCEPERYSRGSETDFSLKDIVEVRQISGFEGIHVPETNKDALLLGVGYDHDLMGQAIRHKESARLLQLLSLPSLSADMYQESLLRLDRVDEGNFDSSFQTEQFCSANDPFMVAACASKLHKLEKDNHGITNFYLCPTATKPQTLGFGLFYLRELVGTASSIIYPFPREYNKKTSTGIGRIWSYPILF